MYQEEAPIVLPPFRSSSSPRKVFKLTYLATSRLPGMEHPDNDDDNAAEGHGTTPAPAAASHARNAAEGSGRSTPAAELRGDADGDVRRCHIQRRGARYNLRHVEQFGI